MDERRTELLGWIGKSQRTRRTLAIIVAVMTAASLALMAARTAFGEIGLAIVAIVAICGFWILSSHIAEWRAKLDELANPRRGGPITRREPD